jgi:hypothetical protein
MLSSGRALVLLLCAAAALPTVAVAQDDEIFVDPDSPSGKEYALPIDRAREQGASQARRSGGAGGGREAPLFGEGVRGDRAAAATAASGAARSEADGAAKDAPARPAAEGNAPVDRTTQAAAPEGSGGLVAVAGAGIGVVLLGVLAGLWLRRRSAS